MRRCLINPQAMFTGRQKGRLIEEARVGMMSVGRKALCKFELPSKPNVRR